MSWVEEGVATCSECQHVTGQSEREKCDGCGQVARDQPFLVTYMHQHPAESAEFRHACSVACLLPVLAAAKGYDTATVETSDELPLSAVLALFGNPAAEATS